eukprot:Polyplicarium_translucidae@DN3175_c0_g1_i1.p2
MQTTAESSLSTPLLMTGTQRSTPNFSTRRSRRSHLTLSSIFAASAPRRRCAVETTRCLSGSCCARQSVPCQQIADLTKGMLLSFPAAMAGNDAALPDAVGTGFGLFMLFHFVSTPEVREEWIPPRTGTVDYSSVCVCHRERLNLGLVCSCCLAIYCALFDE